MGLEQQAWLIQRERERKDQQARAGIWTAIAAQATQAASDIGHSSNANWRATAEDLLTDLKALTKKLDDATDRDKQAAFVKAISAAVAEAVADQNRTEHADQR